MAAALALLAIDLLVSLRLRGLLRAAAVPSLSIMALLVMAPRPRPRSRSPTRRCPPGSPISSPATRRWTRCRAAGSPGWRTTSTGAPPPIWPSPAAVVPGRDDLQLLPAAVLADHGGRGRTAAAAPAALNSYMANGGIILIDTSDGGSGEGFDPGADVALRQITSGLVVPPLAPLTTAHVLARAFYLLQDFPGPLYRRYGLGAARPGSQQ